MTREMALAQLRDIRSLDLGWQAVDGMNGVWIGLLIALLLYGLWRYRSKQHWRIEAKKQLQLLQHRLQQGEQSAVLDDFSTLLRRIAMARKGRQACAGLWGESWLQWLQDNDPKAFPWAQHAAYITEGRYAPPGQVFDEDRIRQLLQAANAWAQR